MYGSWRNSMPVVATAAETSDHAPKRLEVVPRSRRVRRQYEGIVRALFAGHRCSGRISKRETDRRQYGGRQLEQHQVAAGEAETAEQRQPAHMECKTPYPPKAQQQHDQCRKAEAAHASRRQRSQFASPSNHPHAQHQRHGADVQARTRGCCRRPRGRRTGTAPPVAAGSSGCSEPQTAKSPSADGRALLQPGVEGGQQLHAAQQQTDPLGDHHPRPGRRWCSRRSRRTCAATRSRRARHTCEPSTEKSRRRTRPAARTRRIADSPAAVASRSTARSAPAPTATLRRRESARTTSIAQSNQGMWATTATALGWTKCSRLKLENVNSRAPNMAARAAAKPPAQQQPHAEHHQRIGDQILPAKAAGAAGSGTGVGAEG